MPECTATFGINVTLSSECTITLGSSSKDVSGTSLASLEIDFTYVVGVGSDPDSDNYGFDVSYSGPISGRPSHTFTPSTPHLADDPLEVQNGRLVVSGIEVSEAQVMGNEATVMITITMNTGT